MGASGMRKVNAALLLDIIRSKEFVSRAELARLSGLTKPTVSSQVTDLIERGIVVENGAGEPDARGGKPPTMLRFDAGRGALIAAEIGSSAVRVLLGDLNGHPLDSATFPIRPEQGARHVLDVLCDAILSVLNRGDLLCIAVAAPGRVDARSGRVLEAGNVFHWRDVDVSGHVQGRFRAPVLVDNDVNFAALGEMHSGIAKGVENFVLIRLGTGVGAGLVLGGHLYQGAHWAAGEIGHMIFDRVPAAGSDTVRGLLESAIGSDRVREKVRSANGSEPSDFAAELAAAVRRNDAAAARIVDELARQLAIAITDLAATIDPDLIVLAGELFPLVEDRIRETVARVIPWPTRIELSALGADAALMGAMGCAREAAHGILCDWDHS